jgi:hypothetical protein
MKRLQIIFTLAIAGFAIAKVAFPQPGCLRGADISKWKLLDGDKLLAYQGKRYLAFVTLQGVCHFDSGEPICPCSSLGDEPSLGFKNIGITLRFFSPSICAKDIVMVTKKI